jgi:hypothetical protein
VWLIRVEAYLDGVPKFLAVLTLHLAPVLGLGAVAGEVADFLTVAAGDGCGVTRLVALLGHVVSGTAVAAGAGFGRGTLRCVSDEPDGPEGTLTSREKWPISLHFLHSTPSAERGSVHSFDVWPSCLQLRQAKGLTRSLGQSRAR